MEEYYRLCNDVVSFICEHFPETASWNKKEIERTEIKLSRTSGKVISFEFKVFFNSWLWVNMTFRGSWILVGTGNMGNSCSWVANDQESANLLMRRIKKHYLS